MNKLDRYKNSYEETEQPIKENPTFNEAVSPVYEETMEPKTRKGMIVNSTTVNLRTEPSMNSDSMVILSRGDKVQILEQNGEFYKVQTSENKTGFVHSIFCKEE